MHKLNYLHIQEDDALFQNSISSIKLLLYKIAKRLESFLCILPVCAHCYHVSEDCAKLEDTYDAFRIYRFVPMLERTS